MKRNRLYLLLFASAFVCPILGASKSQGPSSGPREGKQVVGQRKYKLVINEGNDSTVTEFNRGLQSLQRGASNRGFLDNLVGLYKTSAAGQAVSLTSSLIDFGVNTLVNATKSRRPDWEKAVKGESTFVRRLPMEMEILDFYRYPSLNGPLDPKDMNFNGFGCKQVIEYRDAEGNTKEDEVFYLSCKVRTDDQGKARMLNHSKFEVYVDTLRFNYAICDLPNDSLGMNTDSRIGFSFDKRKDLKFNVNAAITSSWINQALMVFKDQPLGEFNIQASIDPKHIDDDGVFRYYADRDKGSGKDVRVTGDCFLVPRSYVGSSDMQTLQDSWGTGQYKVEMNISETCRINDSYYKTDGKWDNAKWKPEWKQIKSRKRGPNVWQQILGLVSSQYKDSQWVTILVDPIKTSFIQYETEGLTRLLNPGTSIPAASKTAGQKTSGQVPASQVPAGQVPAGQGGQSPAGQKPAK